jgi:putative oxygen-independent coproporphyrinogen III oxidase
VRKELHTAAHESRAPRRSGVYVHFPWCLAKCPYCDFVSYVAPELDHRAYAEAVLRELAVRAAALAAQPRERRIASVFFGGGTPSLWDATQLGRVLAAIRASFDIAEDLEVTVECNPTSIDEGRARALVDAGVNRLSIGVQSTDNERLRFLGRLHDAGGGLEAVRSVIRAGVPRVSADLIFGLPGESAADAVREALELHDVGLEHLSCYQLTIEAGTRFGELARRGRLPLADDGAVAESFLAIDEALAARGLDHYEVSNYARAGQEARHNLGYWRGDEYVGLGCAAFGFVRHDDREGAGVRYRNATIPERYVDKTRAPAANDGEGHGRGRGTDDFSESREELDGAALFRERVMLGLRTREGVDLAETAGELGTPGWTPARERASDWLASRGRIARDGDRVRIPRTAWLWTDDTAARLF